MAISGGLSQVCIMRRSRHVLHATCHDNISITSTYLTCSNHQCLHAARTDLIDSSCWSADAASCSQDRLSIRRLTQRGLQHTSHYPFFDIFRLDSCLLYRPSHRYSSQLWCRYRLKRTHEATNWCSLCSHDNHTPRCRKESPISKFDHF